MPDFPIHFFTIVLNGQPFIRYHLERMKALQCPWHWHVIEGLADLKHDTAWSLQFGAALPPDVVKDGRSVDGTAEYLDQIAAENPGQVTLYRAPNGRIWDGKLEMVAAPLPNLTEECLLWEIDSDELWTTDQFARLRALFLQNPDRNAAIFHCHYFVGPKLAINRRRRFPEIEWRRAWRFRPGMKWLAHEPPVLAGPTTNNQWVDVATVRPFTPPEMEQQGLVFQHFAYATREQLAFKEKYYGYKDILAAWERLQQHTDFPVPLKQFFPWPWVHPDARVDPLDTCGVWPLVHVENDAWILTAPKAPWEGLPPAESEMAYGRYTTNWKLGYHLLPRQVNRMGLKVGAEIGVAGAGHSTAILERTAVERLYGVDPYRHFPGYDDVMNRPQAEFDALHDNVSRYMAHWGDRFKLLRMTSSEAAPHVPSELDFVYIDAEHSYDAVKKDLETWFPKVRDGGLVSGHDYNHPNFPGVSRAVNEFMLKQNLVVRADEEYFWWTEKIPVAERRPLLATTPAGAPAPAKKQGRGILYVKWGTHYDGVLERSINSVRVHHPELPIHIHTLPADSTLLDKAVLFDLAPFEETLFLDLDTVVLDRLDFGFEMARRHGLACCICECPWARRYGGIQGDLIEYNTGVLFFTAAAKPIFDGWARLVRAVDSSIRFYRGQELTVMPFNDQAGFSLAVAESRTPPFILPFNWNFRPEWHRSWWGPIKVWHDYRDVPPQVVEWTRNQAQAGAVIQYASMNFGQ